MGVPANHGCKKYLLLDAVTSWVPEQMKIDILRVNSRPSAPANKFELLGCLCSVLDKGYLHSKRGFNAADREEITLAFGVTEAQVRGMEAGCMEVGGIEVGGIALGGIEFGGMEGQSRIEGGDQAFQAVFSTGQAADAGLDLGWPE